MTKIRTTSLSIITPLGKIPVISKNVDEAIVSLDEFNEMTSEWQSVLSKSDSFKFPAQDGHIYVIPGTLLKQSYVEIAYEEVK